MKVWYVGIEPLEERYSAQWARWFPEEFHRQKVDFVEVGAFPLTTRIETGAFLDVCGTNYYKAQQLQGLVHAIYRGAVKDGDVIFFADLWFPGLEMLAYIRDGMGKKFRIGGIFHAGTWDQHDFLSRQGMQRWAKPLEMSWLELVDFVCVATRFHKELILDARGWNFEDKIQVTGLPFKRIELLQYRVPKENIVVFPHRLDPEKQPEMFEQLAAKFDEFPDWKFIRSKDICKTKEDYYRLLGRAKVAVSFAQQETFGYAMVEAAMLGCYPVVPNRLSYKELYPDEFKYNTFDECVIIVDEFMLKTTSNAWYPPCTEFAVEEMIKVMKGDQVCVM